MEMNAGWMGYDDGLSSKTAGFPYFDVILGPTCSLKRIFEKKDWWFAHQKTDYVLWEP